MNQSSEVVKVLKEKELTKQGLGQYLAAIFYATGRQDFEKDPRGKIYYTLFQSNYTYSTKTQ